MTRSKQLVHKLMNTANIQLDGSRPQDISVHDERFYARAVRDQVLGLGESYMEGWWDAKELDVMLTTVIQANLRDILKLRPGLVIAGLDATIRNQQTIKRARRNAEHHYNIGNDLYEQMLGKTMAYSCGYWQGARNLDEAQTQKLDLICRKLGLKKGMTVLDIGCGWGSFAEHAARNYGVKVTGITPAIEQVRYTKARTKGLPVTILQKDYRTVAGEYDRIVSIGMFEHIGHKNYRSFFEVCNRLLKPGGMMLHHTIGSNYDAKTTDPWIRKYIFPGGTIPSLAQIVYGLEGLFVIEDVHNFGPDYDKTLMAWHRNFNRNFSKLSGRYDERFRRMWNFYLCMCAAGFRTRDMQLWQIVMRRFEPNDTYRGIR